MRRWLGRRKDEASATSPAALEAAPRSDETGVERPSQAATEPAAKEPPPPAATEARRIDVRELRLLVRDQDELSKGTEVFDRGGLQHLARHGERIFCEASGSGSSPYKVTISLTAGGETRARCSCMAARSRPICKHAAALLVAWSRAPESFVASEAPPVVEGEARRASVRTGRVKTEDLIARGVEQTLALVRELAVAGVGSSAADRPEQIRALAETLRANRLRRLAARVLELADLLEASFRRRGSLAPLRYADVVADLLLAARRIERHLAGETLEDRHMEELVGRTWRKTDRRPQEGLVLLEYAYLTRTTADGFVVRERRLLDVLTGIHYSEKQILPAFMARRTPPLASQPGVRLTGTGGVYPGYAPHRLDLDGVAPGGGLERADFERVGETALAGPAAALEAFAEYRRDVFAPDRLPVAIRADAIVALGDRLGIVGIGGDAIVLPRGDEVLEALAGDRLTMVLGDVDLDGILAVLHPLAVLISDRRQLALRPVAPSSPPAPGREPSTAVDWLTPARAAGASPAALSLGEIRDELAAALVNGLGSLSERVAEPLAIRMADLGLERPSALLRDVVTRPDPADRIDDVVRLHQVLGMGAVRLAGVRTVARDGLIPVPDQPAVLIADPGPTLAPQEVASRRAAGTMTAHEAAVHRSRYVSDLPVSAFLDILPWWVDASAAGHVAATITQLPNPPLVLVDRALSLEYGLAAALTALRVLEALPNARDAEGRLRKAAQLRDPTSAPWTTKHRGFLPERAIRVAAKAALSNRADRSSGSSPHGMIADPDVVADLREQLHGASSRDRRAEAAGKLAALEDRTVLPALRRAWQADPAPVVRHAAARALTMLGDTSMVDPFIDALAARSRQPEDAKAAAYALGVLADIRGVAALLDALAASWKSTVVLEALGDTGVVVIGCIVTRALAEPQVASRRAFVSALEAQSPAPLASALLAALGTIGGGAAGAAKGAAILRLAASRGDVRREVAARIRAMPLGDSRAERQLARMAAEVAGGGKHGT